MSLQPLLPNSKAVVIALAYDGPEVHEIIDCLEEFYSPTQVAVSIDLSLKKVKAVFNRLLIVAGLFGVEKSEEMRAYVVSLTKTNFVCAHVLDEQSKRLPVNPERIVKGVAYWCFNLLRICMDEKSNHPTVVALRALMTHIYQPNDTDLVTPIVHFSPQDLIRVQRPFPKVDETHTRQLPVRFWELILEYAFAPTLEEMVKISRTIVPLPPGPKVGFTNATNVSFQYPFLAEHLSYHVRCITSNFGIGCSLSKAFLNRIAQVTHHYMEICSRPENTNADRQVNAKECHWDMNLSMKVSQLVQAEDGCKDPAVVKIWCLFLRYGIQPESSEIREFKKEQVVKFKFLTPPKAA